MLYTGIYPLFPEWCRRQAGSWICPGTVLFSLFSSRSFCIYSRAWASVSVTFTFVHVFFECIDEFFDRKMIQHVGACHRGDCNTIRLQNNKVAKLRDSEGLRLWKSEIHAVEQWIAVRDKGEIERKFDLFFCQQVAITNSKDSEITRSSSSVVPGGIILAPRTFDTTFQRNQHMRIPVTSKRNDTAWRCV